MHPSCCCCMVHLPRSPRVLAEAYPGNNLAKLHNLSVQLLSEGLRDLGILPGASLDDITRGLYR
jgi:Xaa-Pro aminopeptidase